MLREDLFLEPCDDGSGTKIEAQVLPSNHYAAEKCPRFAARGIPPLEMPVFPHHFVDTFLFES